MKTHKPGGQTARLLPSWSARIAVSWAGKRAADDRRLRSCHFTNNKILAELIKKTYSLGGKRRGY